MIRRSSEAVAALGAEAQPLAAIIMVAKRVARRPARRATRSKLIRSRYSAAAAVATKFQPASPPLYDVLSRRACRHLGWRPALERPMQVIPIYRRSETMRKILIN